MEVKIHRCEHADDLREIVLSHYHLQADDLERLKKNELSDPLTCTNMELCLSILKDIREKHEKILICGDYDCDGICATAILCKAFEACQIDYGFYIPKRIEEGYGLHVDVLEKALAKGYRNIITVDNGVRAVEAMKFIRENHMRLILSDHHTFEKEDIVCDCFIHPFLADDAFYNCCGAGMALQIARCLIPDDKDIVALAALATIADSMPVIRENRNIIRKGIEFLNEGCMPALHALKNKPQDIFNMKMMSYTIIPKINSMGRLSDHVNVNNAVRYLLLKDQNAILNVARQINKINELRKEMSSDMEKIANGELQHTSFEIIAHRDFHEGIVGLVASKMASAHHRPFLILSELENEYKGSMRSVEGFDLIRYFSSFDGFERFGGHAQAAGVTIKKENLSALKHYIETHEMIYEENKTIECEWASEQAFSIQTVMEYMKLAPFGNGFEEILFYIENIQIQKKISLSNGKYYKIISSSGIEYLFFNSSLIPLIHEGMNVIAKVSLNDFRGQYHICMTVEDVIEENIYVQ
ncbi:DHH family phosphoesterase [uncultured Traorella sp.]|uniref:DHH family phosphoesterase n=1 Tax=uncultured Traorella sp. TaxID=1929048 RepID=UPI0025FC4197|nr:DHH family phosphoesterase [uncultured Traorella sp.]